MGLFDFFQKLKQNPLGLDPATQEMLRTGDASQVKVVPPVLADQTPTTGFVASPGGVIKSALGLGAAGLGAAAGVNTLASFSNPFVPENMNQSSLDAGQALAPKTPADTQRLQLVEEGQLPGSLNDQMQIQALDQQNLQDTMVAKPDESVKDQLARISGVDANEPKLLDKVLSGIKEAPLQAQSALARSLQETLGVSISDIESRKDITLIDEMINKSQAVQKGREARRPELDEQARQMRQKMLHPETMSGGEKAAFILAAALPLIASAFSKRNVNLSGIQQVAQFANQREQQLDAANQQNLQNYRAASKDLDDFDARSVEIFSNISGQASARSGVRGQEQGLIEKALKNVEEFETSGQFDNISNVKVTGPEKAAAAVALRTSQAARKLNAIEDKWSEAMSSSGSRLKRFDIRDYMPESAKGFVKLEIANELVPKEYQQAVNAQFDFMLTALRKKSGATISVSEYEEFANTYFISPGDSPETVAQKRAFRTGLIAEFQSEASPAAMSQARTVFIGSLIAEPIRKMGGEIVTKADSKGRVKQFVKLTDPKTGKSKVTSIDQYAELLLQNGAFGEAEAAEISDLLRGL